MSESEFLTHWIGGSAFPGSGEIERLNPSDISELIARTACGSAMEIDQAVSAARAAFPAWSGAPPEFRADILDRAGRNLIDRAAELGELLAREEGKTLAEGRGEVIRAGRILKFFAGEALRAAGTTLQSVRPGVEVFTHREALGVVGLITPWNFPIAIPVWKAAPALAFGNTVVLKPSELTPRLAWEFVQSLENAGMPAGVLNMVFGAGEAGAALASHADVDAISFTGSVSSGRKVIAAASLAGARVQAEMGGKNPLVVLDDADLERAVAVAIDGSYFATGQRCTASSRLIVTEGIHDEFVRALIERLAALKVGHALGPDTNIGPLASAQQLSKTLAFVEGAVRQGASLVAGKEAPTTNFTGHYASPALLTETNPTMTINREEVFGPVASVIRVKDYDEALFVANDVEFGLSSGIVTTSLKYAHHFRQASQAGMVAVNLPTAGVDYHSPFGGAKGSSYGPREQGTAAIEFYTKIKTSYFAA